MTVIFVGLMMAMIAVIWGINKWYLEKYYITEKVESIEAAYDAFNWQLESNAERGISIQEAMKREQDADGNIKEGNLQKLFRDFSDKANVSMLMIDNSADSSAVYSTARDAKFLRDRMERYIFGKNHMDVKVLEENEAYTLQVTFDPWRDGSYLESWGFFSDNSTAFIMSTPLSSISESTMLSNRFLAYVGIFAVLIGGIVVYFVAGRLTVPINQLSRLSEKMSQLDFDARYEPEKGEYTEIGVLGKNMNTLSRRLRDTIGELKSVNNQLQKDIEEKTRIDEMRKEFIANVSHDFRSPLTSIKGYVNAMADGTIPVEMYEKYLKIILFETERLTDLTQDLLTLNEFDTKELLLDKNNFDIHEVIRNTAASFEGTCTAKKISIELIFASKTLNVYADKRKIQQVLYNLLDNAIKFSNPDSIVSVETTERFGKIFISVKDSGIGIPKKSLNQIWERFYKTDLSRGKDKKGTGLGLAIVKEIMKAHGENINVISTEGVGSEFIFSLPAQK